MSDFDPPADRLKQSRNVATLAKLRAAAPAADALAAAVQALPDAARVHVALLKKDLRGIRSRLGWIPDLRDLANLATLRAYFSWKPAPPRRGAEFQRGIEELTRNFRPALNT